MKLPGENTPWRINVGAMFEEHLNDSLVTGTRSRVHCESSVSALSPAGQKRGGHAQGRTPLKTELTGCPLSKAYLTRPEDGK